LGVRFIALVLLLGAIWDAFTTFRGVAEFFDLAMTAKLNPTQFIFAFVVTFVVFGFVMASHFIWSFKAEDITAILVRIAWGLCLVIDLYTSWRGTKTYVFADADTDGAQAGGLVLVTFLIVSSTLLLSRILLAKDLKGKPFLF